MYILTKDNNGETDDKDTLEDISNGVGKRSHSFQGVGRNLQIKIQSIY